MKLEHFSGNLNKKKIKLLGAIFIFEILNAAM